MSADEIRLATRAEIVTASYDLTAAGAPERIVEHGDFVVAFVDGGVDVFRFDATDIADRWTAGRSTA